MRQGMASSMARKRGATSRVMARASWMASRASLERLRGGGRFHSGKEKNS